MNQGFSHLCCQLLLEGFPLQSTGGGSGITYQHCNRLQASCQGPYPEPPVRPLTRGVTLQTGQCLISVPPGHGLTLHAQPGPETLWVHGFLFCQEHSFDQHHLPNALVRSHRQLLITRVTVDWNDAAQIGTLMELHNRTLITGIWQSQLLLQVR
jgi:hypothetical protein